MRPVPGDPTGIDAARLRPSELRAALERQIEELRAVVDILKGALAVDNPAYQLVEAKSWMIGLPRQQRALVGALIACAPKILSHEDLLDAVPGRDHVDDRVIAVVRVLVCRARQHLGEDAIQTVPGQGYFMPTAARDRLLKD